MGHRYSELVRHANSHWNFMIWRRKTLMKMVFTLLRNWKKHMLCFFDNHDIHLVNEDIGQGILYGSNTNFYDLSPVSSSKGFLHWAQKTFQQLLGPSSFISEGLGYILMVVLVLSLITVLKKFKTLLVNALSNDWIALHALHATNSQT